MPPGWAGTTSHRAGSRVFNLRAGAGGRPPGTTLTRIPHTALYAATREWFSPSRIPAEDMGPGRAPPNPRPWRYAKGQRSFLGCPPSHVLSFHLSFQLVGRGGGWGSAGAPPTDPYLLRRFQEARNPNLVAPLRGGSAPA